jgi:hypothetical protein
MALVSSKKHSFAAGLALKNPPNKTQKKTPKKNNKTHQFCVFFYILVGFFNI